MDNDSDLRGLWKWLQAASILGLTTVLIITLFFAAGYYLNFYCPLGNLGLAAFILSGALVAIYYAYRQVSKMLMQFFPPDNAGINAPKLPNATSNQPEKSDGNYE